MAKGFEFFNLKIPRVDLLSNSTRGYHGTTHDAADVILLTDFKAPNQNPDAYLGGGVYFFDNQLSHACDWAKNHAGGRNKGTRIAVIEADISYGKLLNLCNPQQFDDMKWFKDEFERKSNSHTTLATIIDIIAEKVNVDVVRAMRILRQPQIIGAGFSTDIELILAVRNLKNILSKKLIWSGIIGYL